MEDIPLEEKQRDKLELTLHWVIEDTFTKKIVFLLKYSENSSETTAYRSYSDFLHLRLQLSKKWVSLIIPFFPKISVSILKTYPEGYLEKKRIYLEKFLNDCMNKNEIFTSPDFQQFLKSGEGFIENSKPVPVDFRQTYTKYSLIYKNSEEKECNPEEIEKLFDIYKNNLIELKNLKKILRQICEKYDNMKQNHINCYIKLNKLKDSYINCLNNTEVKSSFFAHNIEINPYSDLLNWIIGEILAMKSILEGIEKFFEIHKVANDLNKKIEKKREKIHKLEAGKQTISTLFEIKPISEILIEENFDINQMENLIHCINLLRNIISEQLLEKIIPEFNASKKLHYYDHVKSYCEQALSSFKIIV